MLIIGNRINIPHCDLEQEKDFETKYNYIVFHNDYLHYLASYTSQRLNLETSLWEERRDKWDEKIKRSAAVAVEVRYLQKPDVFCIGVDFLGREFTLQHFFVDHDEAKMVQQMYDEWIFKADR